MRNNNVCKLSSTNTVKDLSVYCFVWETDRATMLKKTTLVNHRIILVEQGEGNFLLDDVAYSCSPGTLIFALAGETFMLQCGENVRYLYIDFNGVRGDALLERFGIYPLTRKKDNFNGMIPFCKDCLLSTPQENIDMAAESILLYLFSRLSAGYHASEDVLKKIIAITEENFQMPELSIAWVAREIGYNPKYLSHYFKKQMNLGFSEYLRSLRFKYAISLFELGISSVKNVALLSGFSDPLYFSSAFKKNIGISPKDFIKSLPRKEKE